MAISNLLEERFDVSYQEQRMHSTYENGSNPDLDGLLRTHCPFDVLGDSHPNQAQRVSYDFDDFGAGQI